MYGKVDGDLEYYKRRYYYYLKDGYYELGVSDSTFRCPFCFNKDYHSLDELLRHAERIVNDMDGDETVKEIAKHSALERFLDLKISEDMLHDTMNNVDVDMSLNVNVGDDKSFNANAVRDKGKSPVVDTGEDEDEFVWPWRVVLANIVTKKDPSGKYAGKSRKKIKEELFAQGFQPLDVKTLYNNNGQTPFAIVEFGKEWDGFNNALMLEESFEAQHCGKKDYFGLKKQEGGDKLFAWMARRDDYKLRSIVGFHLRLKANLKTVSGKEAGDKRKALKLVSGLADTLKQKNKELEQTASKYEEANEFLNTVMNQKEEMIELFNKEISNMRSAERSYLESVSNDHEKAMLDLEARKNELMSREKNLQKRQEDNHNERNKLYLEKKNIAIAEQQKADDKMMRLAEEHQKEKDKLHKKIHDLERGLDAKQALELEVERLRGAFNVMDRIGETDLEEKKKLEAIKKDLHDKEEELEVVIDLQQALVVKGFKANDELQEARKELICFTPKAIIHVKRMGDLDMDPFVKASKRKFPAEGKGKAAQIKVAEKRSMEAIKWYTQWDGYLRDPSWHPFDIVTDKEGISKEILRENDEKLKSLRDELGEGVHDAVVTALKEMNEYNPSGRYPVPELWNFREGRKALLKEGVAHLMRQSKLSKRKKA